MLYKTVIVIALTLPVCGYASAQNYLVDASAIQGGSCDAFRNGWEEFSYDGNANIRYCKVTSTQPPSEVITDIKGVFPADKTCDQAYGNAWFEVAHDGKANIKVCAERSSTNSVDKYVSDIKSGVNLNCDSLPGHAWDEVVWNGNSKIRFCAQFVVKK